MRAHELIAALAHVDRCCCALDGKFQRALCLLLSPLFMMLMVQVAPDNIGSGSSASDTTETLGVRVGKLGQGFVI
jgi:hypothetical protein